MCKMEKNTNILKDINPYKDNKRRFKMVFWDVLAKIALAIVIVYLVAKALGLISSPPPLDVAAIVSGGYFVWRYATKIDKIDGIEEDMNKIKNGNCPAFEK